MAAASGLSPRSYSWRRDTRAVTCDREPREAVDPLPNVTDCAWQEVLGGSPTNTVFQTRPWLETWWAHYGAAHEPFPVTLASDGREIGWAPLVRRPGRAGSRVLAFMGDGKADYLDFIYSGDPDAAVSSLLEQLAARRSQWDHAVLNNMPRTSPSWRQLSRRAPEFGLYALSRTTQVCPALVVENHEQEAEEIAAKYSLRRPCNRLAREGTLRMFTLDDEAAVSDLLPEFFAQHIARWAYGGQHSQFSETRNRDFFVSLWHALAPRGWARFSVVEFNGKAIAFHFGFDYAGRFLWYKPSFDPAFAHYSPGMVMIKHLLDYVIENGRRELDFSIGAEAFKSRFANVERSNLQVRLFHRRRDYLRARIGHEARTFVKSTLQRH